MNQNPKPKLSVTRVKGISLFVYTALNPTCIKINTGLVDTVMEDIVSSYESCTNW